MVSGEPRDMELHDLDHMPALIEAVPPDVIAVVRAEVMPTEVLQHRIGGNAGVRVHASSIGAQTQAKRVGSGNDYTTHQPIAKEALRELWDHLTSANPDLDRMRALLPEPE